MKPRAQAACTLLENDAAVSKCASSGRNVLSMCDWKNMCLLNACVYVVWCFGFGAYRYIWDRIMRRCDGRLRCTPCAGLGWGFSAAWSTHSARTYIDIILVTNRKNTALCVIPQTSRTHKTGRQMLTTRNTSIYVHMQCSTHTHMMNKSHRICTAQLYWAHFSGKLFCPFRTDQREDDDDDFAAPPIYFTRHHAFTYTHNTQTPSLYICTSIHSRFILQTKNTACLKLLHGRVRIAG